MPTKLVKESTEAYGAKAEIVELAISLGVGQWAARLCPECGGGHTKERSLSINVEQSGIIKFHCHRAACGFSGNAYTSPAASQLGVRQSAAVEPDRSLRDPVSPLSDREKAFFLSRYNLPANALENRVYRTEDRYALAILRPDGTRRGFITRRPYSGSPADTAAARAQQNKTLTYLEAQGEPCQSWYGPGSPQAVVIVEDPLSAIRIVDFWARMEGEAYTVSSVAILGTGVNAEKIAEIQRVAKQADVYIALDADATGQAFAMARKWGSAFNRCRVCVLAKDIKDSSDAELAELPI